MASAEECPPVPGSDQVQGEKEMYGQVGDQDKQE